LLHPGFSEKQYGIPENPGKSSSPAFAGKRYGEGIAEIGLWVTSCIYGLK